MISRIEGTLIAITDGLAEVQQGATWFKVLIPAHDLQRLSGQIGEDVQFHTLHYLEAQSQGAVYVPRLIGFRNARDREFFELFTTVKGLGNRKALRALQLPPAAVAAAIAEQDVDVLVSLPEIGKRTAQTIVAELQDKVDRFVELKPAGQRAGDATPAPPGIVEDAISALVHLGETRGQAKTLVDHALRQEPGIETSDQLVAAAFRKKDG